MDGPDVPDFARIRQSLREFNEGFEVVEDRVDGDTMARWVLEWEDGRIIKISGDRGDFEPSDE